MRRYLLLLGIFYGVALSQPQPVPLQVRRIFNITSGTNCIDNRSINFQNNYHSFIATGTGTWSAQMQFSNTSCSGPWTSYGSAALVSNTSNPPIGYGNDGFNAFANFISFVITGSGVSINYSSSKNFYLSTSTGAVVFPVSIGQGGTGSTTASGALGNLGGLSADFTTNPPSISSSQLQLLRRKANTTTTTFEFASGPFVNAADYAFPAQTCNNSNVCSAGGANGATLVNGVQATLTLTPCPLGVNGTDTVHPLLITGGTGTTESTPITGGTCTSGASSGTVIFTPNNGHTGAWTIGSASGGAHEAISAIASTGGTVYLPGGTYNLYGKLEIPASGITIMGAGRNKTILTIPNNAFNVLTTGPWYQNPIFAAISATPGVSKVTFRDFTLNMNGSNNTVTAGTNFVYGLAVKNVNDPLVEDIEIVNSPVVVTSTFIDLALSGTTSHGLVQGNWIYNTPCGVSGQGNAGIWVSGTQNRVIGNYVQDGCNSVYVSGLNTFSSTNLGNAFIGNAFNIGTSTQVALSQAFIADNGVKTSFIGNTCIGNGTGPACFTVYQDSAGSDATDNVFTDNWAINPGWGYLIQGTGSQWARRTKISGGGVTGAGSGGILVTDQVDSLIVENVILDGNTGVGMETSSTISNSIINLTITNNIVRNTVGPGFIFTASSGLIPINNLLMTGNQSRDTRAGGARTQTYGISLPANTAINQSIISNNEFQNNVTADVNVAVGIVSLIASGGVWGPNIDGSSDAYLNLSSGAGGNIFGTTTLVNGLNSNIVQGNYGSVFITGPTAGFSIGGFTQTFDGKELDVFNNTSQAMTIVNGDVSSTLGQRINTLTGGNVVKSTCPCWAFLKFSGAANAWLLKGSYP